MALFPRRPIIAAATGAWILDRATLRVLGNFGRQGRYAGQFHHSHSIAVDSKGNNYVAETQGKRVQRFLFKGVK